VPAPVSTLRPPIEILREARVCRDQGEPGTIGPEADGLFLVWSIEHGAWWRPGGIGYTCELAQAGRYTRTEADRIVVKANIVRFHECAIPVACVEARPSFTCPRCGATSYNPNDIAEQYCGRCHVFTGDQDV
jgi:hypothetical protein